LQTAAETAEGRKELEKEEEYEVVPPKILAPKEDRSGRPPLAPASDPSDAIQESPASATLSST